ncbi:hypothetical protein WA026_000648 [Henosepilachna vigintioctopunctata]|uniref:Uncharacterized protein n=1 Tax=Henosepilachna vigintioctopunctata TaxID=420089 RepID=A0AAW1V6M4_9CUCU
MRNKLFIKHINEKKLDHFPNCKKAVEEARINFHWKNDNMKDIMKLQSQFSDRFNDFEKVLSKVKIFANHFSCDIEVVPSHLQINVIAFQSNDTFKSSFYGIHDVNFIAAYHLNLMKGLLSS